MDADARFSKRRISVTFFAAGIHDKSMGFSGSFLITIIIIHPLTTAQLLHDGALVATEPVLSLACVTERLISWLVDVN